MALLVTTAVALFVLGYTYVGYPVLIAILARLFPRKTRPDPGYVPSVSALIAVHNGEAFVAQKIDSLLAQDYPPERLEVVLCSDGSTDRTNEILAKYAVNPRVKVLHATERGGKPRAINLMLGHASGDVLLMTDIRQPLSNDAVRRLVRELADPYVGCASGELELAGKSGAGVYWKYESLIRSAESRFRSLVGVTGALYVIRKEDFAELPPEIVLDDMWVPMRQRLRRKRVVLVPGAVAYDQAFEDARELPRKVRTLAGNYQLFAMMPALLVPFVNPSWFETVSHKILRLVCPWALVVLLGSSLALLTCPETQVPRPALLGLVGAQALFYLAALFGRRAGRLGGLARTFVVLNSAAILGLFRYLKNPRQISW